MSIERININLDSINDLFALDELERAFTALAKYTKEKTMAILFRLNGKINEAIQCESNCDRIYNFELPEIAKW